MYGLPANFNVSVFKGRVLDQVCFTVNQVILCFGMDLTITVEGAFAHFEQDEAKKSDIRESPINNSRLMTLLGHEVREANGEEDGTLCLYFDNAQRFVCYDDRENFESYRMQIGDSEIVV